MSLKNRGGLCWSVFSKYRPQLMGVAIIIIITFHWCENYTLLLSDWKTGSWVCAPLKFVINGVVWIGACGVEVFLFLSGIGLYYSFTKKPDVWIFLKRRFVTILVPYIMIAVPYLLWQNFIYTKKGLIWFLKDLTLLTTFTPFNRQSWYVALILFLYVLFPFLYFIITRWGSKGFAFLEIIFLLLPFLVYYLDKDLFDAIQVALTRIPMFILGIFCGKKVIQNEKMKWFPLIMIGFAILVRAFSYGGVKIGLARIVFSRYEKGALMLSLLCFVVWALQLFSLRRTKHILSLMSPITLELYLTHVEVRRMFSRLFTDCWTTANITLAYISILFISVPVAYFFHQQASLISKKILNCGNLSKFVNGESK